MRIPSNDDRASWARAAVETFRDITRMEGEDLDTVIGDLFCNLRHLAARENITTLETKWAGSLDVYHEEVEEEFQEAQAEAAEDAAEGAGLPENEEDTTTREAMTGTEVPRPEPRIPYFRHDPGTRRR